MMRMRVIGVMLAPFGAVLILLAGWWPTQHGYGGINLLGDLIGYWADDRFAAFVLTPAGAVVLAASLALLTWPRR